MQDASSSAPNILELEIILPTVKTQIPLTQQFRVQATESLTNTDTLRKMSILGSEESNQVSAAGTDIIDRERFGTGWATDVDHFTDLFFKIDKGPASITDDRTHDQQPFTCFVS